MAALVAPAEPVTTEPPLPELKDRPFEENEPDQNPDDLDEDEEEHEEGPAKEWDEGGKSHCGYNVSHHAPNPVINGLRMASNTESGHA
jgi:hypothetical protein